MRFRAMGMLPLAVGAIAGSAVAQNPPAQTVRTVVAATKLPTVTDAPLYFTVASVELAPGTKSSVSKANGILYQLTGSTEVSLAGEVKKISAGEGLFIGGGKTAELKSGAEAPSAFLHFFLAPGADLEKSAETGPAVVKEVYRTTEPIPDLRPGGYDLNLTRVTFPAGMPANAPHHRSGAALYYVLSGTGANTIEGKVISRPPGSFIYEPFDLVHQWGNPGNEPLTFITFNINPEGVAAVRRARKDPIETRPETESERVGAGIATRSRTSCRSSSSASMRTCPRDGFQSPETWRFVSLWPRPLHHGRGRRRPVGTAYCYTLYSRLYSEMLRIAVGPFLRRSWLKVFGEE